MGTSKHTTLLDSCKNIRQWIREHYINHISHLSQLTYTIPSDIPESLPLFVWFPLTQSIPLCLVCLWMFHPSFYPLSPSSWKLCNQFSPWWSGLCLPHPAVYSYNCTHLQVQSVGGLGGKVGDSLPVGWYIKCWSSSPLCLLVFAFQSSQIVSHEFSPSFISALHWERQGAVCLFHLTWNVNTVHLLRFISELKLRKR